MEILLAFVFFVLCFFAMGIGVIVQERGLRGSCGGDDIIMPDGSHISCGACHKKEAELCPSDDDLVQIAQISHPNPRHSRSHSH